MQKFCVSIIDVSSHMHVFLIISSGKSNTVNSIAAGEITAINISLQSQMLLER